MKLKESAQLERPQRISVLRFTYSGNKWSWMKLSNVELEESSTSRVIQAWVQGYSPSAQLLSTHFTS
jgi:hypothetical protein